MSRLLAILFMVVFTSACSVHDLTSFRNHTPTASKAEIKPAQGTATASEPRPFPTPNAGILTASPIETNEETANGRFFVPLGARQITVVTMDPINEQVPGNRIAEYKAIIIVVVTVNQASLPLGVFEPVHLRTVVYPLSGSAQTVDSKDLIVLAENYFHQMQAPPYCRNQGCKTFMPVMLTDVPPDQRFAPQIN